MIPATILNEAAKDGVRLTIAANGAVKIAGGRAAVRRWRPIFRERKAEVLAVLGLNKACATEDNVNNSEARYCWWRINYADRPPLEIAYCPPMNHAEVEAREPSAVTVELFVPTFRRAEISLSGFQEALIRRWLTKIGETDIDTIEDLLARCQIDADAREYFLKLAEQIK